MQISYNGTDSVAIKTKTETVTIGPDVRINGFTVPGPGEYDIASIQCEGKVIGEGTTAYFIRAEELTVTFLPVADPAVNKLDDVSATNILIIDVRSDDTAETIKGIVKSIEPSYLVLLGAGATSALMTTLDLPALESGTLKLTRSGLPLEGTSILPRG